MKSIEKRVERLEERLMPRVPPFAAVERWAVDPDCRAELLTVADARPDGGFSAPRKPTTPRFGRAIQKGGLWTLEEIPNG